MKIINREVQKYIKLHSLSSTILEFPILIFFNLSLSIKNCHAERTQSMKGVLKKTLFAEFN